MKKGLRLFGKGTRRSKVAVNFRQKKLEFILQLEKNIQFGAIRRRTP